MQELSLTPEILEGFYSFMDKVKQEASASARSSASSPLDDTSRGEDDGNEGQRKRHVVLWNHNTILSNS